MGTALKPARSEPGTHIGSCEKGKMRLEILGGGLLMDTNILNELVTGILAILKSSAVRVVLYGSVARGTATEESDVDIAVLVKDALDKNTEDKLSDFLVDMNLKYDKVFSVIDIDYDTFRKWEKVTPFYQNVNKEGIVLWTAA